MVIRIISSKNENKTNISLNKNPKSEEEEERKIWGKGYQQTNRRKYH